MNKILGTANFRYQQEMNEMQQQTFVQENLKRYVKTKTWQMHILYEMV